MMKNTLTLTFVLLLSACTNHLYSGTTSYEFNDKQCRSMVYWNDLTHFFDREGKATTVVIKTPNGRSYPLTSFTDGSTDDKADDRLGLILPSGEYIDSVNQTTNDTELLCGVFNGKQAHQETGAKETEFYLYCDKKPHPLRKSTDTMKASETPYIFAMNEPVETFSWFTSEEIKADISMVKCE